VLFPLPPGISAHDVSAGIAAVGARLDSAFPLTSGRDPSVAPVPAPRGWAVATVAAVNRDLDGEFQSTELVVMSVVGLVLVVACTNLANLVLARGASRTHELAVRRALGASRARLVLEQLTETGLLAVMGAVGAFVVARALLIWLTAANVPISESTIVQIEPRLDMATVMWAAVALGLIMDLAFEVPLRQSGGTITVPGAHVLAYALGCQLVLLMRPIMIRRNPLTLGFLACVGALVANLTLAMIFTLRHAFGAPIAWETNHELIAALGSAAYTGVLGLFLAFPLLPLAGPLGMQGAQQQRRFAPRW
jgi:lysylphosphatidylglycerol synthetase-like protein (DUF2156 family)